MKLLLIEDEIKTAAYVSKGLREHGFVVDCVYRGDDGLHLAMEQVYDLVLLDVMLPGRSGWEVIAGLRQVKKHVPILFLTARDAVEDKVRGLELGADDYLVKPFAFSELLARIQSILRRSGAREADTLSIADLEIDWLRQYVRRAGVKIQLTAKEFALLSLFARRRGEILSRTLISEQVWDMNFDSDTNVVDVSIRRLRVKIDDPFDLKLIHTVRGRGYVFDTQL